MWLAYRLLISILYLDITLLSSMVNVRMYTYDLILQTVEDKDEKSLQRVEDGEGISHAHRLLVQVQ